MKKIFTMLAGAVMLLTGSASAAVYTDSVDFGLDGILINGLFVDNLSTSEDFSVSIPSNQKALSYRVEISFVDLLGGNESFTVTLGSVTFPAAGNFGPLPDLQVSSLIISGSEPAILTALENGTLPITVSLTSGTYTGFTALTADLEVTAVPDGGSTVALLGIGMIGLAGAAKRFGRR